MEYMHAMEYYLIMKAQEEVKLLTRKITRGLTRIDAGLDKCISRI